MSGESLAWYCARTKPKHEHIAAAILARNLKLQVFHPQLRVERSTRRGTVHVTEPLFPCYVFFRCVLEERLAEIQRTKGISSLVHFGNGIPKVKDSVIEELQECFEAAERGGDELSPGDKVTVGEGTFAGTSAFVLRVMPARLRVQVLLDILGNARTVEVDRSALVRERGGAVLTAAD